jgi:hypothetical protein
MRRVTTTLALALCLLGCSLVLPWDRVELLTSSEDYGSCDLMGPIGKLTADPKFGTVFDGMPVMWPPGFTGRRVGSEVEVLNPSGKVVATTGRSYEMFPAGGPGREVLRGVGFHTCGVINR